MGGAALAVSASDAALTFYRKPATLTTLDRAETTQGERRRTGKEMKSMK